MFQFSVFDNLTDNTPKLHKKWKRFLEFLEDGKVVADKKAVKLYSPAIYLEGAPREIGNVDHLTFGVGDIDSASEEEIDEILEIIQEAQLGVILHTTHSHFEGLKEGKYKCRLIFRFNRPVLPEEWDRVWFGLNELCNRKFDKQCRNPNAIYFFPSCPPGHVPILLDYPGKTVDIDGLLEDIKDNYVSKNHDTAFAAPPESLLARIDVATRLDLAKQYLSRLPPAIQGQEGDMQTLRAGFIGKDFGLSVEEYWPIFQEYNERCDPPWKEKELERKLSNSYKYSKLPAGWRLTGREHADVVDENDIRNLIKKLSKSKNTAPHGRILRSMLDGEALPEQNALSTMALVSRHIAKEFQIADPNHIVTFFQDCLDTTDNRDVNAETFAQRIRDAQEEHQANSVQLQRNQEMEKEKTMELAWLQHGFERTSPYAQQELIEFANLFDGSLRTLNRHWIVRHGRSFYFLSNGSYDGPYTNDDAHNVAFRLLAPAQLELTEWTPQGVRPLGMQALVDRYGSVAKSIVADMTAQHTSYDLESATLTEAPCPMRTDIEPHYRPYVHEWLKRLCGVDKYPDGKKTFEKVQAWLACLSRIDKPCAALYLYGVPGTGKSLLGHTCSRLWTDGGPTEIDDIAGNFNSRLANCPLVLADETIPMDPRGAPKTELLRKLIQERTRTYRRKFIPDATLKGSIRLVLASNNLDFLTSENQSLNHNDIEALVERFLLVVVHDAEAQEYINKLPAKKREALCDGVAVVEHALWLRDNFEFVPGNRFLVEGMRGSALELQMTTSSGLRSEICQWLASYITEPNRIGSQRRQPIVSEVDKVQELLINPTIIHTHWKVYVDALQAPKKASITKALEGLTRRESVYVNGELYQVVELPYIEQWAIDKGHCGRPSWEKALVNLDLAEEIDEEPKKSRW